MIGGGILLPVLLQEVAQVPLARLPPRPLPRDISEIMAWMSMIALGLRRGSLTVAGGESHSRKVCIFLLLRWAWGSFITSKAILLVTAVGLVVHKIPSLQNLPLGGKQRHCVDGWKVVCNNSWVKKVIWL